jgi:hypothetical protein
MSMLRSTPDFAELTTGTFPPGQTVVSGLQQLLKQEAKGKLARRRSQLNPLAKRSDGSEKVVLDKAAIERNLESDN